MCASRRTAEELEAILRRFVDARTEIELHALAEKRWALKVTKRYRLNMRFATDASVSAGIQRI
jgi:hypothetical protein